MKMQKSLLMTILFVVATLTVWGQKHDTKVIITGYMPNPVGADVNHEYVQLMATEDINFAQTPYAVITAFGSPGGKFATSPPEKGWVTGLRADKSFSQTVKFNLDRGTVKAGEFFYVGGAGRKLNGRPSARIDPKAPVEENRAKWMRTLRYNRKVEWSGDDGVGGGPPNVLFANNLFPQGIAVFDTKEVTEMTVPVDVVFIGRANADRRRFYRKEEGRELGYRICNNDRYTTQKGEFFTKGENSFVYKSKGNKDDAEGRFYKLGGVYDAATKTWVTPRGTVTEVTLPKDSSGRLSQIETGTGQTQIKGL